MRAIVGSILGLSLTCSVALAEGKETVNAPTDAERARVKAQVESLQKRKLQEAAAASQSVKNDALRKGKVVDENSAAVTRAKVDRAADSMSWYYGHDAAHVAGSAKKQELTHQAEAEKQKIAEEAKKRAALHAASSQKSADNINESVEGLKSQVSKDGKFGLQPTGTNLHVRNYGKN